MDGPGSQCFDKKRTVEITELDSSCRICRVKTRDGIRSRADRRAVPDDCQSNGTNARSGNLAGADRIIIIFIISRVVFQKIACGFKPFLLKDFKSLFPDSLDLYEFGIRIH